MCGKRRVSRSRAAKQNASHGGPAANEPGENACVYVDDCNGSANKSLLSRGCRAVTNCGMRAWRAVSDRGIWGVLDILSDIFTVCFAMCDILMDTWIAYTYYTEGRTGFFYISLALLMLAQICYASLFICTFAETKSGWTQLWMFLCVLPFGQLVPLLVYVESLHLEWFEEWILWFGFDTTSSPVIQPGEDFMLYRIRVTSQLCGGDS